MSSFSFIAFPRAVDTSCIKNSFDESKAFTVAQVRGTELEKQCMVDLNALPDDAKLYFGDIVADFRGIQVFDKGNASFTGVITNPYVYSFRASFELLDAEKYIETCLGYFNDDGVDFGDMSKSDYMDFIHSEIKNNREDVAFCRKQLHELIQRNICPGEIVEIYSEYVTGIISNLGPEKEKTVLDLSEILTSELLRLDDDRKIEIHFKTLFSS